MKICYILAYRQPNYIRTTSLVKALQQLEQQEKLTLYQAINRRTGLLRYIETLFLLLKIRLLHNPDCYLLGFRGHEIFWLVRLITWNKTFIFDSLLSPSAALRIEQKHGKLGQFLGNGLFWLEKKLLHSADIILTDTSAHVTFLAHEYDVPLHQLHALPVGAIETLASYNPEPHTELKVLFYGSFLPLHGVTVILQAIQQLPELPIHFTFIGGDTHDQQQIRQLQAQFSEKKITHLLWVELEQLLNTFLANTDVCLGGPFGNTAQAHRVITTKTSQALAIGCPVIIGASRYESFGFIDRDNCFLIEQGNSQQLAETLLYIFHHRDCLKPIGAKGQLLYQNMLSIEAIATQLATILSHE